MNSGECFGEKTRTFPAWPVVSCDVSWLRICSTVDNV